MLPVFWKFIFTHYELLAGEYLYYSFSSQIILPIQKMLRSYSSKSTFTRYRVVTLELLHAIYFQI